MADDPFGMLLTECLNLTHRRFASASGVAYPDGEADTPAAARKDRERPFLLEFYHQFRRLWDKALPVQLGLGHVVIQPDPNPPPGRKPDLLFWQLGERGSPDRPLAAVCVVYASNPAALDADLAVLARYKAAGYAHPVCVVVGRCAAEPPAGVRVIAFDPEKWAVA